MEVTQVMHRQVFAALRRQNVPNVEWKIVNVTTPTRLKHATNVDTWKSKEAADAHISMKQRKRKVFGQTYTPAAKQVRDLSGPVRRVTQRLST